MPTITKSALSSSELGTLWMTYQNLSLTNLFANRFAEDSQDKKAKSILTRYVNTDHKLLNKIEGIFNREKTVIPMAFTNKDIFDGAPSLFDDIFHIMFLRIMMKIKLGFNAIHFGMSYRDDIMDFYASAMQTVEETYA